MATPGRKPKAPHLKLIEGRGEGKDSAGREIPKPINTTRGLPVKPDYLSLDAEWLWDQVIEQWRESGLLKPLDAAGLEVACETFARWREAVRHRARIASQPDQAGQGMVVAGRQGLRESPFMAIEERAAKDFRAWCSEFGFTPAAENQLRPPGDDKDDNGNPFD